MFGNDAGQRHLDVIRGEGDLDRQPDFILCHGDEDEVSELRSPVELALRSDRGRELTKAFVLDTLPPQAEGKFDRGPKLADLVFVTMTEYE
ncbi:MAG TPA: hypothetical protein VF807_11655, partial [Ktedonobacterales bacterium]